MSAWGGHVADYLRLRRQLGFSLKYDEHVLGQFSAYLEASRISCLTTDMIIQWASLPRTDGGAGASRAAVRMRAVRAFADYMHSVDPAHQVPARGVFTYKAPRQTPFIFTPEQVASLLHEAARLRLYERSTIYPVVFGLLASTGIRIGELLALDSDEVDLDEGLLTISRGKSRDPRLVPVHETVAQVLGRYSEWRDQRELVSVEGRTPFFTDYLGKRLTWCSTAYAFEHVRDAAGLTANGASPRIHDLRHTFAVTTFLGWYREGADVPGLLPRLSTYLGHSNPANTYWYMTAIPELLAYAAGLLERAPQNLKEALS